MAIIKSCQVYSRLPLWVLFLSIIGGACATTEKDKQLEKNDSAKVEVSPQVSQDSPSNQVEDNSGASDGFLTPNVEKELSLSGGKVGESLPLEGTKGVTDYILLEKGQIRRTEYPLPDLIPFTQKNFGKAKTAQEYLRFRGWDFNRDGLPDMVEELNEAGDVIVRAYDFNNDGKPDKIEVSQ